MNETRMVKCIDLYKRNLTSQQRCEWVKVTDDCFTESYVNYLNVFFCNFNDSPAYFGFKFFLIILWLIYLFTAIQTIAASFMCTSLFKISKQLHLSENLSSVTLYSFGVATPCIFSAISGIMNEKPQIVIGALFGSASFITQLIIGSIFALATFRIEILPFLRDCFCYLILIVWIFYIFIIKQQIDPMDAYGFLIFYAVYIVFAFLTPRKQSDTKEGELNDGMVQFELSTVGNSFNITPVHEPELSKKERISQIFLRILSPIDEEEWSSSSLIKKVILIIKLPILFLVELTTQMVGTGSSLEKLTHELRFKTFIQMILGPQLILEAISLNKNNYIIREDIPISMVVLIVCIFVALFFYYFVTSPKVSEVYASWHSFVLSIFWVYLVCEETVSLLRALSIKLGLTEESIGQTILAWGNASLDLFADINIVLEGKPRLASSATIIAPFISLLLGVGIPCSLLFLTRSHLTFLSVELSEQLMVMFISVTVGLIITTLQLILNNFKVSRAFGVFIIFYYLFTMVLEFGLEFKVWSFEIGNLI